jgi:hypothetical protein
MTSNSSDQGKSLITRRNIVISLLSLEAAGMLFFAIALIIKGITVGSDVEWYVLSGVVLFLIGGGAGLVFCAKSFKDHRNYGRAPAILANLIALGCSKYMFEGEWHRAAITLALVSATVVICAVSIKPAK